MTLEEVARLVKAALPKGRHQGVKVYILPRVLSTDELCAAEPWIRFVLAEEVTHRLWVAFVDEEPGVVWDHRSRLILVDDEIAEVLIDLSMHFCPSLFADMQPLL
jgi:hypothetical protein